MIEISVDGILPVLLEGLLGDLVRVQDWPLIQYSGKS